MGSTFVDFRGGGFEASDATLEIWLLLLVDAIDEFPDAPDWLKEAREEWHTQATAAFGFCVKPGLDRFVSSPEKPQREQGARASGDRRKDRIMHERGVALWKELRSRCLDPNASGYDLTRLSDSIAEIIGEIGDDAFLSRVAEVVDEGAFTLKEGALLVGVASYSTDDQGSRIQRVLEQWLEAGADETRVALALSQDTLPFRSRARRLAVLTAVATRFPQFGNKCRHWIDASQDS